jgi:hypothetical protein
LQHIIGHAHTLKKSSRGTPKGHGAARLQTPPQTPKNRNLKITDFVDITLKGLWISLSAKISD